MGKLQVIKIAFGLALLGLVVCAVVSLGSSDDSAPEGARIKITETSGKVHWSESFSFDDLHRCVVFVNMPDKKHTVVCGNFRMEKV